MGSKSSKVIGWLGPDRSLAERAALFAAAAVVGPTFEPGLQPRKTVQQAAATGIVSALTLTGVTVTQSSISAIGRIVTRDRSDATGSVTRGAISIGVNAAAAAGALAAARALPPHPGESFKRGLLRTVAERSGRVAVMSTALASAIVITDQISEINPNTSWLRRVPLALPAGVAVAAWHINKVHKKIKEDGDTTTAEVSTRNAVPLSIAVGAGVLGMQSMERVIANGVAKGLGAVAPKYQPVVHPIGHFVSLAILGGALAAGYEYLNNHVEQGGAAKEPAYEIPPSSKFVSGGPESAVTFESLSREGRRFVNMALTAQEIENVMGEKAVAEPIRAFVGLDSSPILEERIDLLMDELVRTGAFDREVFCFASSTGSGYINYVMAEALEYMTLGNCAISTIQYSLKPSFLSLDRTSVAVEQNRAAMHAITGYLRGMPAAKRPRFVLFGESLGAQTMQDVYKHRTVEAMDHDFVSASVYVGTPAATGFAKSWRLDPARVDPNGEVAEVADFGEYLDLPAERRAGVRHALVTHHDDPIPKFAPSLLVRQPEWLGPEDQRPMGVPKSTKWRPLTTFILTGVDLLNAMDVVPGTFGRRGHDYREDLPRFVDKFFGNATLTAEQMLKMETALRERELVWAERRLYSEEILRTRESVTRQLKAWGVTPSQAQVAKYKELLQEQVG